MSQPLSPSELHLLRHEADVAARRLMRQLRLKSSDLADVRQDLLVDALARLKGFDPQRGALGAFLGTVMANKATRIALQVKAQRRLYGAHPLSLDDPSPDTEGATRGNVIAEADGYAALCGQPTDAFAAVGQRIDLERRLGILTAIDRTLCAQLTWATVEELASQGRGARSSLYRHVKNIRLALTAVGLRAA
jgi:DNA-directed RNA polymerase specialized sigma24 family protein